MTAAGAPRGRAMFGWLTDVFASSGFVPGQLWAEHKNENWQALKAAYAT